jgi:hypothetical protein
MINPDEAPDGYEAVAALLTGPTPCHGCAFDISRFECGARHEETSCTEFWRKDGESVIFIEKAS